MRIFGKANKLEYVIYDIYGPVVYKAARMEEQGMKILTLNIGNPAPFGFTDRKMYCWFPVEVFNGNSRPLGGCFSMYKFSCTGHNHQQGVIV